ncbi:MAG TPA: selenium cofactor biosynthesis protein YqeC [Candidatus Limnocylindrales bacterium]|nr:selenium cofactor biosynthesis protein YqeC [Candidatus Limnocylindrales bacterium]
MIEHLSLYRCLGFEPPAVVSFYGAGGKTTLIGRLAAEMRAAGQKVLLTTTTKICRPVAYPLVLGSDLNKVINDLKRYFEEENIAVFGKSITAESKVEGVDPAHIEYLFNNLPVSILVEADGARGRLIKGYAEHEPVLPGRSDMIVPVIGFDALGKAITPENAHRYDLLLEKLRAEPGQPLTDTHIAACFKYMKDLGHAQAPRARIVAALNRVDLVDTPARPALAIARELSAYGGIERLLVTTGLGDNPVRFNFDLTAGAPAVAVSCVVLAAGTASRMGGQDKLALTLQGKTILEHTLEGISEAGIEDIIVVTRPNSTWPQRIGDAQYKFRENPHYKAGLASSLKAGLATVDSRAQGVIFALADQPLIPAQVYRELIENYRHNLKMLTCPVFRGKRGNPTLFDRRTWPLLMQLTGDRGGRQIMASLPNDEICMVESAFPAVLMDIDTHSDYQQLLRQHDATEADLKERT